jgi:DNA-binding NarL/FixJ family response regulator
MIRDGLERLLEAEADISLAGHADDGVSACELTRVLAPDILLLDIEIPILPGLDVLRRLSDTGTMRPTLLLAATPVSEAEMTTALKLGAHGVVVKDSASDVLLQSLRAVARGGPCPPQPILSRPVRAVLQRKLTPRERQVVQLVLSGASNKMIAQSLSLSEDTVKHHLMRIFDKTGVSSRLALAMFVMEHGLLG